MNTITANGPVNPERPLPPGTPRARKRRDGLRRILCLAVVAALATACSDPESESGPQRRLETGRATTGVSSSTSTTTASRYEPASPDDSPAPARPGSAPTAGAPNGAVKIAGTNARADVGAAASEGGTTEETSGDQPAPVGPPLSATRKAPYDYGCAVKVPCSLQDDNARHGRLRSVPAAKPCVTYSLPPLPCVQRDDVRTYAGVRIGVEGPRTLVTASAVVRPTSSTVTGLRACLTLIDQADASYSYSGGYCQELAKDGTITFGEQFDISRMTASVLGLYVSLEGDGTATVERISYTVS